jgi:D-threo-aldose 1-dehydrogenase
MQKRNLGRSNVEVTSLSLGGGPFGNLFRVVQDSDVDECIDAAYSAGVRYFDTSPYYGFGLSERRVGDALRRHQSEGFVLSTKVGRILEPLADGPAGQEPSAFQSPMPFTARFDYTYDGVMRSFEASLQRLGLGRIDILLFHDLSRDMHAPEVLDRHFAAVMDSGMKAAHELKRTGDIRAIGFGINFPDIALRALGRADFDCVLLASRYTPLEDRSEGLLEACLQNGIGVIAGAPFNSGILVTGADDKATYDHVAADAGVLGKVKQLEAICTANEVPLPALALQFPLRHPSVATVLPGARSREEMEAIVRWTQIPIPGAAWDAVSALHSTWFE